MVEIKRELRTYRVFYICDKCKKGKQVFQGLASTEGYVHICEYCKHKQGLDAQYPYLEYEEK